MTASAAPPRSRRNWLRLSLRSLLVLVTLLAVWMALIANRAREQRRIVTALAQYPGAMIMYAHEWDVAAGGEIPKPRPLGPPPGPAWRRCGASKKCIMYTIPPAAPITAGATGRPASAS